MCSQGFASSAEIVRMQSEKEHQTRRQFLLGAMSKFKSLSLSERVKIADTLGISVRELPLFQVKPSCLTLDIRDQLSTNERML